MKRWRRRLLVFVSVLAVLAIAGTLFEWRAEARDAERFPPTGTLVDVGGQRLHLVCAGSGRPTVIFEQPGFANATSFSAARTAIAQRTRVCSYDRPGVGWSDPAPYTTSVGTIADDLAHLQDRAHLEGPFIIVTASIGGVVTEMFARRYPDRVAGLLYLDAATSDIIPIAESRFDLSTGKAVCLGTTAAGHIGLLRLVDPWDLRASDSEAAARSAALMYRAQPWNALCSIVRGVEATKREFAQAPPLRGDLPLVVLSAETSAGALPLGLASKTREEVRPLVREMHRRFAQRSSRGSWRIVPGTGHLIAGDKPQVVVDEVLGLISSTGTR
jgi:pimeloyl-ACP methyl ester carboxylesterase